MKIDHDALVLVIDGGKMLLFRNQGDGAYPKLRVEEGAALFNPAARDQGTDAPGRAFASVGTARSAVEQTDFHDQAEGRFAAHAVELLNKRALAGEFQQLVIVAPPAVLGEMRQHYHKALKERLAGEIGKDLTGHHPPDIERAISEH